MATYTLTQPETWFSLAQKLMGNPNFSQSIMSLNPGVSLTKGVTIKIPGNSVQSSSTPAPVAPVANKVPPKPQPQPTQGSAYQGHGPSYSAPAPNSPLTNPNYGLPPYLPPTPPTLATGSAVVGAPNTAFVVPYGTTPAHINQYDMSQPAKLHQVDPITKWINGLGGQFSGFMNGILQGMVIPGSSLPVSGPGEAVNYNDYLRGNQPLNVPNYMGTPQGPTGTPPSLAYGGQEPSQGSVYQGHGLPFYYRPPPPTSTNFASGWTNDPATWLYNQLMLQPNPPDAGSDTTGAAGGGSSVSGWGLTGSDTGWGASGGGSYAAPAATRYSNGLVNWRI